MRDIKFVEVTGDHLAYRVTGSGIPLLCIAGGGGNGDFFLPLADQLSSNYKVITYDRRANAGSTINSPNEFSIEQQAKDAVAILDETDVDSAYILGNSSGAVIALEVLKKFPNRVKGIIVHEPPLAKTHPQKDKWLGFFKKCYDASFKLGGPSIAATKFLFGIEVPTMQLIKAQFTAERYLKINNIEKQIKVPSKLASKYLIQQELLPVVTYEFDEDDIEKHLNKVVLAVGDYAKNNNTFLYQIVESISKTLGVTYVVVPGHHGSFMDDEENWAKAINQIIAEHFEGRSSIV